MNQNNEEDGKGESNYNFDETVYQQLRMLARGLMRKERSGHTISPTELVHNAYVKMSNIQVDFVDEKHYFRTMARQMRRLLVDYARQKSSDKRAGSLQNVALTDSLGLVQDQPNFVHINDAIEIDCFLTITKCLIIHAFSPR